MICRRVILNYLAREVKKPVNYGTGKEDYFPVMEKSNCLMMGRSLAYMRKMCVTVLGRRATVEYPSTGGRCFTMFILFPSGFDLSVAFSHEAMLEVIRMLLIVLSGGLVRTF